MSSLFELEIFVIIINLQLLEVKFINDLTVFNVLLIFFDININVIISFCLSF